MEPLVRLERPSDMTRQGPVAAAAAMLALTATVLAGCGSEQSAAKPGGGDLSGDDAALDGRSFLSTAVTPRGLEPGTRIRLSFDAGSLSAHAGCNHLGAEVRIENGRLRSTGGMVMTEMGCRQPMMDQDDWLANLLGSGPEVTLDGDALQLRGADGTVVELLDRRVADPDRPLVGTEWVLDAIIDGTGSDGMVSSIPQGITATLIITDGRLSLMDGCNSGSGIVVVEDEVLRVGGVGMTLVGCSGERVLVSDAVHAVVKQGEVAYTIEADRLTLTNGAAGLVYRAE